MIEDLHIGERLDVYILRSQDWNPRVEIVAYGPDNETGGDVTIGLADARALGEWLIAWADEYITTEQWPYGSRDLHLLDEEDGETRCANCQQWCSDDPQSGHGLCMCCEHYKPQGDTPSETT